MFDRIYNNIYFIGLMAGKAFKRFFKGFVRMLVKPFKALSAVLFAAFLVLDRLFLKTVRAVGRETGELVADVRRVFAGVRALFKEDKKEARRLLTGYVKKAFSRHGVVFSFAFNVAAPAVALVVLCVTISYWSQVTLALEINYNGAVIGYTATESVYLAAEEQAKERLVTASTAKSADSSLIKPAQYQLKIVEKTDLSDAPAICEKLIENSDSNITNACGIYIDGEFLCAVKNETDATSIFDKILTDYENDDPDAVTGFVEEITYEQGLYPDNANTVWDAAKLAEKLNSKKSEAVYYEIQTGDTLSGIAQKFDISTAKLMDMNPNVSETIHIGQRLLVSSEVNYIRVQVTKTETHTETLAYTTTRVNNANLYKGTTRVTTKGVNGQQRVTELVTYVDGVRVSSKEVSRETTKEAVNEVVQIGTKSYSSYSSSGSAVSYGGRFVWPAIGATSISSGYGGARRHGGVDIVRPGGHSTGLTIVAAASGTVTTATYHSSWGYYIVINHGNGLSTLYAHMLRGSFKVRVGQRVSAGQPIGNIGSSGNVTGPHLHFEVRVNGNRTNPRPYLGR